MHASLTRTSVLAVVALLGACGGSSKHESTSTVATVAAPASPPVAPVARSTPSTMRPPCDSTETASSMACAMELMPYFRDTMCSCTSAECASGVQTELTAWMEKMARSGDPSSVPTAAQQTELEATSHEYFACSAKLHDARPSTPGSGTP